MKFSKIWVILTLICVFCCANNYNVHANDGLFHAVYNDEYSVYLTRPSIISKDNYHKISDAFGSPYLSYEESFSSVDLNSPEINDNPVHNDKNGNSEGVDKKPNKNENKNPVESDKNVQNEGVINSDEIYWLARIIEAEAGGEPYKGKLAVGSVIINRVNSSEYPSTIYGVIFDRNYGVQFTPTVNGTIYNEPSAESIKASKGILTDGVINDRILYFVNHEISKSEWFKSKKYVFTIGKHTFYSN